MATTELIGKRGRIKVKDSEVDKYLRKGYTLADTPKEDPKPKKRKKKDSETAVADSDNESES